MRTRVRCVTDNEMDSSLISCCVEQHKIRFSRSTRTGTSNVRPASQLRPPEVISKDVFPNEPLGTMHPIYRTGVPLVPRERFLYIYSTNIFNYIFRLSLTIFVYSSPKCRVFLMLPFLVRKIFTFYINGVLNCKCPASGPKR